MSKLLLHTCCAPCVIYPWETLQKKGFEVTGLYYNPNIYPEEEFNIRKNALEIYNQKVKIDVIYQPYDHQEFLEVIGGNTVRPARCIKCWELRLKKTAQHAKQNGFEYFTSTLLVSPHQDQDVLKNIGERVAQEEGVKFYYEDFRPGYRDAHNQAKAMGLYCQKYCGCEYSIPESKAMKKK